MSTRRKSKDPEKTGTEPGPAGQPAAATPDPAPSGTSDVFRAAIYVSFALLIGILAALGIQGDTMQRMIRTYSDWFALALTLLFAGAAVPLATGFWRKGGSRWLKGVEILGVALMVAAISWSVYLASDSIRNKEAPSVTVTVRRVSPTMLHLVAKVHGTSLLTYEKAVMGVFAMTDDTKDCDIFSKGFKDYQPNRLAVDWSESTPNAAGVADITFDSYLSAAKIQYVCAWGGLELADRSIAQVQKKLQQQDSGRFTVAFVDAGDLPAP
ncbi:hypothetical protein [Leifsonia sp. EB34]|uniref:hypothetical protein n=1 Tax=Leifsonia sp. EB34 TaxID=3156303 RepID=UPI003516FCC4